MTKHTLPFSRERAVRMVLEHQGEHGSQYGAIRSIAAKIGCSGETLRNWARQTKRPVVLFVDEAHDLHHKTLSGLKRLREVVADGDGVLPMVLAGHPRPRNALMRSNIEEVGFRFAVFPFEGMAGHQAGYIAWLLGRCLRDGADPASVIEPAAVELLVGRLRTPLQVERLTGDSVRGGTPHRRARRHGGGGRGGAVASARRLGTAPDPACLRCAQHRRRVPPQAGRHATILQGQLDPVRTRELTEQMPVAGLPV